MGPAQLKKLKGDGRVDMKAKLSGKFHCLNRVTAHTGQCKKGMDLLTLGLLQEDKCVGSAQESVARVAGSKCTCHILLWVGEH